MRAILRLGPYLVLVAVGVGLALAWGRLPARYPVHWGPSGADRWADLSPRSVGVPLLLGAIAVAWTGWLRRFTLRNSDPSAGSGRVRRVVESVMTGMQWCMAILFGLAAIPREGPGLVLAGAALAFLVAPASLAVAYLGKVPAAGPPVAPPPEGWLFVERRLGAGLGIDPRHPRFWRAVAVILAGPAAMLLVAWLA